MIFKRIISSIVSVAIAATPIYSSGQVKTFKEYGAEAKEFGTSLNQSINAKPISNDNGRLNLGSSSININDIFPGTSSSNTRPDSYYFPDGVKPEVGGLGGMHEDSGSMDKVGSSADKSLLQDSQRDNPSLSGAAYKILLDGAYRSRPDFSNDPMLNQSKETFNNIDEITKAFGECKQNTDVTKNTTIKHLPSYERCERIDKPAGGCKISHQMNITHEVTDVYIAGRGRDVITVRFDLKDGSFERIAPTDSVEFNQKIPKLDYQKVCGEAINSKGDLVGAWDWVDHGLGMTDSTVNYNVLQMPDCNNGLVGIAQVADTKSDSELNYVNAGKFTFRITKQKADTWGPESCINDAKSLGEGFCTGSFTVTQGPATKEECVTVNGISVCPGDSFYNSLSTPPLPGLSKLDQVVELSKLQCDFNVGQMDCWTDPQGVKHCPTNEGKIKNSCEQYEKNPQCGFISTTCLDGAKDNNGVCYVYEDTYDCGHDVEVDDYTKNSSYQCSGAIKCMGDECLTISNDQNGDFAKAAALLQAAQFMAQDMQCSDGATSEGGDENLDVGCKVFSGTPGQCKIAVGGVQNCCKKPENISMADYITMILAVPKLDSAILSLDKGSLLIGADSGTALKGAYQTLRDPVVSGWQQATKPFASFAENISSSVDSFTAPVKEVFNQFIDEIKKQIQDVIANAIKNGMTSAGADGAAVVGAEKLAESAAEDAGKMMTQMGNVMSTMMTVYTVYVVTMVMIQLIWACEKEEFEMNAKRQLKSCTFVGSYCKSKVAGLCIEKRESYCCYNSPLSRIMNEQIRAQQGRDFGNPKSPSCEGLTLDEIGSVNWDRIDLTEWLAILGETGNYPSPETMNFDNLTGKGSALNTGGDRKNAVERSTERINGIDIDKIRRETATSIKPKN